MIEKVLLFRCCCPISVRVPRARGVAYEPAQLPIAFAERFSAMRRTQGFSFAFCSLFPSLSATCSSTLPHNSVVGPQVVCARSTLELHKAQKFQEEHIKSHSTPSGLTPNIYKSRRSSCCLSLSPTNFLFAKLCRLIRINGFIRIVPLRCCYVVVYKLGLFFLR